MICTRDKAVQAAWTAAGLGALIAAALTLRRWGFDTLDAVSAIDAPPPAPAFSARIGA